MFTAQVRLGGSSAGPRVERKEFSAIGLVGKLRVTVGQTVGDRWIKMREISDTVHEYLVR